MDSATEAKATVDRLNTLWGEDDDYAFHARNLLVMVSEDIDDYVFDFDGDEPMGADVIADLVALHAAYCALIVHRPEGIDESITQIALDLSLCPIHFGDYASCFDDDVDECRAVRVIHPLHDT